jgi:RNA polymerase sigma-70 factor (ECF subfamily)
MEPESAEGEITALLRKVRNGDREAESRLVGKVYDNLHRMAAHFMRRERFDHTLRPTALVHEAYLRLVQNRQHEWADRAHFFAVAASVMRRILVDHARRRHAGKRGGHMQRIELSEPLAYIEEKAEEMLALDQALSRLAERDARMGRIVEMRFFGGMTDEEIAGILGIGVRTVKRDWSVARAWLRAEIIP